MSKIMYKDKPYMSTADLPEMTLTEARTGTEEEPRVISPKTLFEFAVNRLTGNIDIDTSAASGDDYDLTQALTSLGWLTDVVTSGVLGGKKLLIKILEKCGIAWETIEASGSYSAGTVGTRGAQWSTPWTHGNDYILAMTPVYVGDSSAYIVQPFYSNNTIYVNFYRASASAQNNATAQIRVVRMKAW